MIFFHYAFLYVSSNYLSMHDHTGCICFPFLLCGFSNEFSNGLPVRMQRHIGHICATFLECAFANASLTRLQCRPCIYEDGSTHTRIGRICLTVLHCVFSQISPNRLHTRMQTRNGCICVYVVFLLRPVLLSNAIL